MMTRSAKKIIASVLLIHALACGSKVDNPTPPKDDKPTQVIELDIVDIKSFAFASALLLDESNYSLQALQWQNGSFTSLDITVNDSTERSASAEITFQQLKDVIKLTLSPQPNVPIVFSITRGEQQLYSKVFVPGEASPKVPLQISVGSTIAAQLTNADSALTVGRSSQAAFEKLERLLQDRSLTYAVIFEQINPTQLTEALELLSTIIKAELIRQGDIQSQTQEAIASIAQVSDAGQDISTSFENTLLEYRKFIRGLTQLDEAINSYIQEEKTSEVTDVIASVIKSYIGLFDPKESTFYIRNDLAAGKADETFIFGAANQNLKPLSGDWNGDGSESIALYNSNTATFNIKNALGEGVTDGTFVFGAKGEDWIPIAGDWNGDGKDTIGLYNPSNSTFYLKNALAAGNADVTVRFGPADAGWLPIAGDWNGDGKDTIGLYNQKDREFYLRNALEPGIADIRFAFGPQNVEWIPIAGDWNGNGKDTIGLYDPSESNFHLKNDLSAGNADTIFRFGPAAVKWIPIVGHWGL